MKKTFLLSALILLITLILTLCSCNNPPEIPPADSESESLPADTDVSTDSGIHKIIENGVVNYVVVRVENASKDLMSSISAFHKFLSGKSSERVIYETDYSLDYLATGKHDESRLEIVIGNTNYEKSAELMSTLNYGEYRIEASGNKIFVVSLTDEGLDSALKYLQDLFTLSYDSATKSLSVTSDEVGCLKSYNSALAGIPLFENGKYELAKDGGDGSTMLIFKNVSDDAYDNYVNKLLEMDYKEYYRNDNFSEKNKYILLTKGDAAVNVLYTGIDSRIRVIVDDLTITALPAVSTDYTADKKVCDSLMILIGNVPIGGGINKCEGYLIRCEDGKFIVIDGGVGGNGDGPIPRNTVKRLYDTIVQYTPSGMTPTVASWIITHRHLDHVGAFKEFAPKYTNKLTIEQFIFNYPLNEYGEQPWPARQELHNIIASYFKNAKIVKPHPGQIFQFANVKMETLYSIEMLYPKAFEKSQNNASLVTRFYIGEHTILMPGDMGPDAYPVVMQYYGDYLKSEFYQVAHHGVAGVGNSFNVLVDPTWVLWPSGEKMYEDQKFASHNAWFSDPAAKVKMIFVAGFQTTVINFPFDGTNYTITPNT